MTEKYCPVCKLVHIELLDNCCVCDGVLIEKKELSDEDDNNCPICIRRDNIEMA